jgi:hypothetical protein
LAISYQGDTGDETEYGVKAGDIFPAMCGMPVQNKIEYEEKSTDKIKCA